MTNDLPATVQPAATPTSAPATPTSAPATPSHAPATRSSGLTRLLALGLIVGVGVVLVSQVPDMRRYLKLSAM